MEKKSKEEMPSPINMPSNETRKALNAGAHRQVSSKSWCRIKNYLKDE